MLRLDEHQPYSREQIFRAALDRWGAEAQMRVLQEECCELSVAVSHFLRGRAITRHLVEEIADVEIMLEQMRLIIDAKEIEAIKAEKIKRLETILKKEEMSPSGAV